MLVAPIQERLRTGNGQPASADLREWVNEVRAEIPAVTHVDPSARDQTVNVRGEPIVCTPEDAYRCFMRTEMDHLVLGAT